MIKDTLLSVVGQKLPIPLNGDTVGGQGSKVVLEWLHKNYRISLDSAILREQIGTDWVARMARCQGTFPKRVGQYLKKLGYLASYDAIDEEALGNLVQKYRTRLNTGFWDIDTKIDWAAGAFGDPESCFMKENSPGHPSSYIQTLKKYGILALRVYNEKKAGIGRCWVWIDERSDNPICFNAYGVPLVKCGGILAAHLGAKDERYIGLALTYSGGGGGGGIYINGTGHVKGAEGYVVIVNTWPYGATLECALKWSPSQCQVCHSPFSTNNREAWFLDERLGEAVCPQCTSHVVRCAYCGTWVNKDGAFVHKSRNYCSTCVAELFTTCKRCDVRVPKGETHSGYCTQCYETTYPYVCAECGRRFINRLVKAEKWSLCSECLPHNNMEECPECHAWHRSYIGCDQAAERRGA